MNENELMKARLADLAQRAYDRGYVTYSEFLNMNEISLLKTSKPAMPYVLYGGFPGAERCVAAFGDDIDEQAFPIVCLQIEPLLQKFADKLSHRDVLGALMNLGINRNTLGDILLKENTAYLFCLDTIAPYITENLTRIKHTTVSCQMTDTMPPLLTEEPAVTELVAASLRADAVTGAVYKLSRSEASRLFAAEKVFLNGVVTTKDSVTLKDGDIVSVRGYGRYLFTGIVKQTKKQRLVIAVRRY